MVKDIPIYLSEEDAKLFIEFQKRYTTIAHIVGCMEGLNIQDLRNVSIVMDIDDRGIVQHTAITKHYR